MSKPQIALVVPCYNESESLPFTIKELEKLQKSLAKNYTLDLIFVNDGSADNTQEIIEKAADKNPHILYVEFAGNAGHQSALRAGLNHAVGYDAVAMMDADLQHPPELIPKMIERWESGAKVVQMIRSDDRDDVGFIRYYIGWIYYRMLNFVSDLKLEHGASDFRIVDSSVIDLVAKSTEQNLFLRGYFSWLPVTYETIEYVPAERVAGQSKYSLKKLLQLTYFSIVQFSEKPLRISISLGMFMAAASILYGIYLVVMYAAGEYVVSGWSSLMTALLFLFGLNFILLGIIGHYLGHVTSLVKERPAFVVASKKSRNLKE